MFISFGAHSNDEMRTAAKILGATGTFALLCDLTAIIIGARATRRVAGGWSKARTFGVIAITLGALGITGALLLFLLATLLQSCADCDSSGCLNQLNGIGSAVAR